jgi:hypothetical protein
MTPQECVLDAVMRARGILSQHIEPGPHDCDKTISRLFALFDDQELATAINILNLEVIRTAMAKAEPVKHSPSAPPYNRTTG